MLFRSKVNIISDHDRVRYKCNDIITAISNSVERDKRLINEYEQDEIIVRSTRTNGTLRKCRFFTVKGLERYVHEGKIYSYVNVCEYFNFIPKDKQHDKWKEEVDKCRQANEFITKKILKWVCEKRKIAKELGNVVNATALIKWLASTEHNESKAQWLTTQYMTDV